MKLRTLAAALTLLATAACVQHTVQKKPIVDATTGMQSLSAFGGSVTYPPAAWVTSTDIASQSDLFHEWRNYSAIWQQTPKGQEYPNWRQVYSVVAKARGADVTAVRTNAILMEAKFIAICGRENFEMQKLSGSPVDATYLFVCKNASRGNGPEYREGVGQIALQRVGLAGPAIISVEHSWRGAKFDFQDKSTWPVSPGELEEVKSRFRQILFADLKS